MTKTVPWTDIFRWDAMFHDLRSSLPLISSLLWEGIKSILFWLRRSRAQRRTTPTRDVSLSTGLLSAYKESLIGIQKNGCVLQSAAMTLSQAQAWLSGRWSTSSSVPERACSHPAGPVCLPVCLRAEVSETCWTEGARTMGMLPSNPRVV
ncbi:hypothetical protein MPH_09626 [Macrophomina phaseolina MS6]|uniref:Uncharacterized protein n=1 Tax=Macrophomina phaseolina (strain MS6) TaxID=1126212 RepID=K2RSY5_MACPH|nr:hypothetical protein MPH_09626 [Macrophomina phaseolina MS6]